MTQPDRPDLQGGERFADLNPPYSTIVADPPWAYRTTTGITTRTSHGTACAEDNYRTMNNVELANLPVSALAADTAHLYLWTTNPKLPDAFRVMAAWGFTYKTTLTWVKEGTLGLGFFFRGMTEHVLFGVRGNLPIPPERRQRNVFTAAKVGHSIKPGCFGDLVEQVSPGPYLELFARQPRLGWDSWGHGYQIGAKGRA